jgi:hypothetical protein
MTGGESKTVSLGESQSLFEGCVFDGATPDTLLYPVLALMDVIMQAHKAVQEAPLSHPAPLLPSMLPLLCAVVACSRASASHKAAKKVLRGAFPTRWQYHAACDEAVLRKELDTLTIFGTSGVLSCIHYLYSLCITLFLQMIFFVFVRKHVHANCRRLHPAPHPTPFCLHVVYVTIQILTHCQVVAHYMIEFLCIHCAR